MRSDRIVGLAVAVALGAGLGSCAREKRYDRGPIVRTIEVLDSLKRTQPEHREVLWRSELPEAAATADSDSVERVKIGW